MDPLLSSHNEGRNKIFKANTSHPLFEDIRNIVLKSTGIDKVISNIITRLGNINKAFIRGDYARGLDSGLVDLIVIGSNINQRELERVRVKTEKLINRKISILLLTESEYARLKESIHKENVLILFQGSIK